MMACIGFTNGKCGVSPVPLGTIADVVLYRVDLYDGSIIMGSMITASITYDNTSRPVGAASSVHMPGCLFSMVWWKDEGDRGCGLSRWGRVSGLVSYCLDASKL